MLSAIGLTVAAVVVFFGAFYLEEKVPFWAECPTVVTGCVAALVLLLLAFCVASTCLTVVPKV